MKEVIKEFLATYDDYSLEDFDQDTIIDDFISGEFCDLEKFFFPSDFWSVKRLELIDEKDWLDMVPKEKKALMKIFYKEVIEPMIDIVNEKRREEKEHLTNDD